VCEPFTLLSKQTTTSAKIIVFRRVAGKKLFIFIPQSERRTSRDQTVKQS